MELINMEFSAVNTIWVLLGAALVFGRTMSALSSVLLTVFLNQLCAYGEMIFSHFWCGESRQAAAFQ